MKDEDAEMPVTLPARLVRSRSLRAFVFTLVGTAGIRTVVHSLFAEDTSGTNRVVFLLGLFMVLLAVSQMWILAARSTVLERRGVVLGAVSALTLNANGRAVLDVAARWRHGQTPDGRIDLGLVLLALSLTLLIFSVRQELRDQV